METLLKDIRYAIRGLLNRPGFTVVALITLALGIGANTAIFSLVNSVLLRSVPVEKPEEIVSVAARGKNDSMLAFSYPNFIDFRDQNQVLSGLLAYRFVPLSIEFVYVPELWVPASMMGWVEPGSTWIDDRGVGNFFAVGRLKPGIGPGQAEASLNLLALQLATQYPNINEGLSIKVVPTGFIIPELRNAVVSFTWILMASVAVVLLVTCTNIAGLLLARATDRRREIAIRLAIGANRLRLIRQLLTESVLLSLIGGIAGFLLGVWIVRLLVAFKPAIDFPLTLEVGLDWRVLVFSLSISLITGAMFGLTPALQATRPELLKAIKDNAAQGGDSRNRLRSVLVVAQIALSLVVLIAAGLVVRTLQQLQTMNPGFDADNALMMSFDVGLQGYDQARGENFYRQIVERVGSIPGVKTATITSSVPLGLNYNSRNVFIEGQTTERGANAPISMNGSVGPRYFEAMGTPIKEGREFNEQDKNKGEAVAIVNETFVKRMMPFVKTNAEAINRRLSFSGAEGPFVRIVGVAAAGKYWNIAKEPRTFIWTPISQDYNSSALLIVRSQGPPEAMFASVRKEVQSLDSTLPLFEVKTLTEHMRLSLFPARVAASVLGVFGLVALVLSAIGIYGITSFAVAQRTREIGIRMALGAQLADVLKLVLTQGVKLTILGVAFGLLGAFLVTRAITSVLYGVSATDPLTFVLISLLLTLVALLACYVPARRATRVDPLVALRYE